MFLGYAKNHTASTYRMLNLRTKHIVLSRDAVWLNRTHSEYISRKETTKVTSFILHDEDEYNKRSYVKMDPVKTEDVK